VSLALFAPLLLFTFGWGGVMFTLHEYDPGVLPAKSSSDVWWVRGSDDPIESTAEIFQEVYPNFQPLQEFSGSATSFFLQDNDDENAFVLAILGEKEGKPTLILMELSREELENFPNPEGKEATGQDEEWQVFEALTGDFAYHLERYLLEEEGAVLRVRTRESVLPWLSETWRLTTY